MVEYSVFVSSSTLIKMLVAVWLHAMEKYCGFHSNFLMICTKYM